MPPPIIFDPVELSSKPVLADRDEIQKINLQRFEMAQLDAIVLLDPSNHLIGGYKDVRSDEFWVRGHMPGYPLLPGVLICEAAAQLCSYYHMACVKLDGVGDFVGFGGMDEVRFRLAVKPGQRLYLVAKAIKVHRRQVTFNVQGFVDNQLAFHGNIIGIALHRAATQPNSAGA